MLEYLDITIELKKVLVALLEVELNLKVSSLTQNYNYYTGRSRGWFLFLFYFSLCFLPCCVVFCAVLGKIYENILFFGDVLLRMPDTTKKVGVVWSWCYQTTSNPEGWGVATKSISL